MLPELVADSKLNVNFHENHVSHEVFDSSTASGIRSRRRKKEEHWERQKFLGRGGFGTVWLEKCLNDSQTRLRAVKSVPKSSYSTGPIDYTRELEAIAKFSQRKYDGLFVQSFGWYEDLESVFITMEYFELGDLQKHLTRPLPEPETQHICFQILEALENLHANGFAHRDLKPANIFVVQKRPKWWVKIGDFGISKRLHDGDTAFRTVVGTETHLAPEVLFNRSGGTQAYTYMVDMWSLGVMSHYILTRDLPFRTSSELSTYTKDNQFPYSALQSHSVSRECQDFIRSLLTVDPALRLAAKDALEDDWIKRYLDDFSSDDQEDEKADYTTSPPEASTAEQLEVGSSVASARWSNIMQSTTQPQAETTTRHEIGQGMPTAQRHEQRPTAPPTAEQALATLWSQKSAATAEQALAALWSQESATTAPREQVSKPASSQGSWKHDYRRKLVIVGDASCGKTSLLTSVTERRFDENPPATICDDYIANIEVDGKLIDFVFWDTSGIEEYARLRALSYPDSHVIVICFAIDSRDSFDNVEEKWMSEVLEYCAGLPLILVGCKKDLRNDPDIIKGLRKYGQAPVTAVEGEAARMRIGAYKYLECSAKTAEGVREVFETASRAALLVRSNGKRKKWYHRIL